MTNCIIGRSCRDCLAEGICPLLFARLVSDKELGNPKFIRDVRNFAYLVGKLPSEWKEYLNDEYAAFRGIIIDKCGCVVELDLEIFEVDDDTIFMPSEEDESASNVTLQNNRFTNWFEEWCCTPCPEDVKPTVRKESRERVRVLATILRCRNEGASLLWGKEPANDNTPQ
jgi:hypothetical protein